MTRSSLLLSVALVGGVGCVDYNIDKNTDPVDPLDKDDPCIVVDPGELAFDDLAVGVDEPQQRLVTISNECSGDLEIFGLSLKDDGPYVIGSVGQVLLSEGSTTEFSVTFDPIQSGSFPNRVFIDSNDPATPTARVKLSGKGIAPDIEVSPEEYDFGAPFIGCETAQPFEITNIGNADLIVDDAWANTASGEEFGVDMDTFTNGNLPFVIAPLDDGGTGVEIFLEYTALDQFSDKAYLTVASNDPFQPEVIVGTEGTGTKYGDNLDIFEQPIKGATDILVQVDRSCSMSDEAANVANNIGVFVTTMASLDADFHLAAVEGDAGCIGGSEPYIDNSFDTSDAVDTMTTMIDFNTNIIPYGSNEERAYMVLEAALSNSNLGSGGCNEDWYRSKAFLSLIAVSDEPEQSVNPWAYYISYFQAIKDTPDDLLFSAIGGDYPGGCGGASPYTGAYEGTVATGGLFLSICATDFGSHMETVANASVSVNDSFELTQLAVPQTIEVRVDGINMGAGWSYDPSTNSVVFQTDYIPAGGSTVEIEYALMPDCEG